MKRQVWVALLAFLVSVPLTQAIQSCFHALGTSGSGAWLAALGDVLLAGLALSCAVAVLALLDQRQPPPRMIALLDWRGVRRVRLQRARADAAARGRV